MKVGDLVKFKTRTSNSGPLGVVLDLRTLEAPPHPSQPDQRTAYIEWACEYTPTANYQLSILEIVNESR